MQARVFLLQAMLLANGNAWAITPYLMITPQTEMRPGGTERPWFHIQTWEARKITD